MLCYRHRDSGNIHFLKGIQPQKFNIDVSGDCHHRNGIHIGGSNSGDEIGSARTGSRDADTRFSCRAGITVSSMGGTLFMCSTNMVDSILIFIKRIVDVENGAAWIAKYRINALFQQTFHENLRTSQFHKLDPFLFFRSKSRYFLL